MLTILKKMHYCIWLPLLLATVVLRAMKLEPSAKLCHKNQSITLSNISEGTNVFIGTGLWSNKHGLTVGMLIDVLSMLITAHQTCQAVKKQSGKESRIIILIADHLAHECGADLKEVHKRTTQNKIVLQSVNERLGIDNCKIVLSSAIVKTPEYRKIHDDLLSHPVIIKHNIADEHKNYAITQTALCRYMQLYEMVIIKLSWARLFGSRQTEPNKATTNNFDELWFDRIYRNVYGDHALHFLYTKPGFAWQKDNQNNLMRPPYTHAIKDRDVEKRILFYDQDNTMEITGNDVKNMNHEARSHYRNIIEGLIDLNCSFIISKRNNLNNQNNLVTDLNSIINLSRSAIILRYLYEHNHPITKLLNNELLKLSLRYL